MKNTVFEKYLDDQIDILESLRQSIHEAKKITPLDAEAAIDFARDYMVRAKQRFKEIEDKRSFNSWVVVRRGDCDGDDELYTIVGEKDYICYATCNIGIFGDCSNETIESVVIDGRECEYSGWMPDMYRTIMDKNTGEIVYENQFPEWDH